METKKPHAVCIPFPTQGHISPMLKLANLLHNKGFHITFVNTEFNHRRLLKTQGPEALKGLPSFHFETIPDGLPSLDDEASRFVPLLCRSTTTHCLAPFKDLLAKLNDTSSYSNVPQVSYVVSDAMMSFTLEAAEELGIPDVFFWCASACSYLGYMQHPKLIDKGLSPLNDESYLMNGFLDQVLDWIPGIKGVRLRDLGTSIRTTNPDEYMVKFVIQETDRARKASAIILNTFEDLERDAMSALSSFLPALYAVGPLQLLQHQVDDESSKSFAPNLQKEDPICLKWLDSREPNSVLYVSFGSRSVMSSERLLEFAWGLANSKHQFLWIIRPDLVSGDSAILPLEFFEGTKERGLLASWCLQEKVLSHASIGGWNSALESITSGVPMICWPHVGDQHTNCWYLCSQLGIGLEMNNDAKRDEVENAVRELMVGGKGKEMQKKAVELKKLAEAAANKLAGGSSLNLTKLINQVLLP